MAASLGDLIQIIDKQLLGVGGDLGLNIYYYRVTSITGLGGTYLEDIGDWFDTNVVDKVRKIQMAGYSFRGDLELRNLTNATDFFIKARDNDGLETTGQPLPPFVTLGWRLNREGLTTRNGYKRFGPISEARMNFNTFTPAAGSDITDITAALAADIILGLVTVCEPVIVKRPIPIPATGYVYNSIGSATFRGVGTQNTRKVGRGI